MSLLSTYYFAARYGRHGEMRNYRAELLAALPDARVTSRWIDQHGGNFPTSFEPDQLDADPSGCWMLGHHDIEDIDAALTLVSFTEAGGGGKGGRHTEYGYAIAQNKRLVIIGPREHIFHTHPGVEIFSQWGDFLQAEVRLLAEAKGI